MLQDKQKKKSPVRGACVVGLALTLLMSSAGAYTVERVHAEDLFDEELLQELQTSDWAKDEVYEAQVAGLVTASTNKNFTHSLTRFQFADLVTNMLELVLGEKLAPAPATTFPDTDSETVLRAVGAGVVNGLSDGTFGGDKLITRQEICVMLYRAMTYLESKGKKMPSPTGDTGLNSFNDADQVASWASEGVKVVVERGVMNGSSKTTLTPLGNTSVEQGIILIYRLFQKY